MNLEGFPLYPIMCEDNNAAAERISSCRQAFYTLQGAGLCKDGLSTESAMHVWSATCKSSLLYACEAMAVSIDSCIVNR